MSSLPVVLDLILNPVFEDIPVSVLLHPREPLTVAQQQRAELCHSARPAIMLSSGQSSRQGR